MGGSMSRRRSEPTTDLNRFVTHREELQQGTANISAIITKVKQDKMNSQAQIAKNKAELLRRRIELTRNRGSRNGVWHGEHR